jgi:hypothetical protein
VDNCATCVHDARHACSVYDNGRFSHLRCDSRAQRDVKRGEESRPLLRQGRSRRGCFSGWVGASRGVRRSPVPSRWRTPGKEHHALTPSESYTLHTDESTCARPRARYALPFPVVSLSFPEFRFEFGSSVRPTPLATPFSGTCWKTSDASNVNFLQTSAFPCSGIISDLAWGRTHRGNARAWR